MEVMGYSLQLEGEGHAAAQPHNGTWRTGAGRMAACRPQLYSYENQNSFPDVDHDKRRQLLAMPPSQLANGLQTAHASSGLRVEVKDTLPTGRAHSADLGQSLQRQKELQHAQQPLQHTTHWQPSCIQNPQCGSQPLDRGPPGTWQPMHISSQPSSSAPTHNLQPYTSGGGSQPEHSQALKRPFEDLSNGTCTAVGRPRPPSNALQTSAAGLIHQQARHPAPSQADCRTDDRLQQCFGAVGPHQTHAQLAAQQSATHVSQPQPPHMGTSDWQQQQQHPQQTVAQLSHQHMAGSWHPLHSGLHLLQQGAGTVQRQHGQSFLNASGQPHVPQPPLPQQQPPPPQPQHTAPQIWVSQQRPPDPWQQHTTAAQHCPQPLLLPPPRPTPHVAPQGRLPAQLPTQEQQHMARQDRANLHSQPQRAVPLSGQHSGQHGLLQPPAPATQANPQGVGRAQGLAAAGDGPQRQRLATAYNASGGYTVHGERRDADLAHNGLQRNTELAHDGLAAAAQRPPWPGSAVTSGRASASGEHPLHTQQASVRHQQVPAPAPRTGTSGVGAGMRPGAAAAAAADASQHARSIPEDQHRTVATGGQQQTAAGSAVQPQQAEAAGRSEEAPRKRAVQGGEAAAVDAKRMDRVANVVGGGAAMQDMHIAAWQQSTGQQDSAAPPDEQQRMAAPAQPQPVVSAGMPPTDKIKVGSLDCPAWMPAR